jgi:RNA polymerase sigma-70 factor (ECF subfamily)
VERDEGKLVQRCLAGDQAACAELVQGYARMVGTVIWRATGDDRMIEDLAQETFLRLFHGLPYFDARAKLSTWIYTIAHRVAIDHLRKLGRAREEPDGLLLDTLPASDALDPAAAATREEIDRLVRDGLAQLPDKYRLQLVYSAIDGLDHETIGAMLGVPRGTVKTLVFRGKRMLKDWIVTTLAARTAGNEVSDAL